ESFRAGRALNKPIQGLCRMRHLLRHGHHALTWAELRVGFLQDSRGTVEEILAGQELRGDVVRLQGWTHGSIMAPLPAALFGAEPPDHPERSGVLLFL